MLYVICYMLYVICYMLYVICYVLYVICYMLNITTFLVRKRSDLGLARAACSIAFATKHFFCDSCDDFRMRET